MLLVQIEAFISSKKGKVINVVHYPGDYYFFPGIDKRYKRLLSLFEDHGYKEKEETQDMTIDLQAFDISERQKEKITHLKSEGVMIRDFDSSFINAFNALHRFRAEVEQPTWFHGWEKGGQPANGALIAIDSNNRLIGFCEYRINRDSGDFGPLAVLMEYREKGVGSVLLLEAMLRLQKQGVRNSIATWVWPLRLYEGNGWSVYRRYAILEKRL